MKKIELKDLPLKESDFVLVREYVECSWGHEWQMKRYEVSPELLGITDMNSVKEKYGNYYAIRLCSDKVFIEIDKEQTLSNCIDELNRYYKAWQLGKYLTGMYLADEAREIFENYKEYFDYNNFPAEAHHYQHELQEKAAEELGLQKYVVCFISRQDKELYVSSPETMYTLPDEYGRVPVYVHIDNNKVKLRFASRYDQTILGKSLINYNNEKDFENVFNREEPQRFSIGKLTEKKKQAWFSYIRDYSNEATRFFIERHNAVAVAEKKLKDAGFERIGDSMSWRCSKGYFDCKAEVGNDGKIYTDISISYKSNVREEVFGI